MIINGFLWASQHTPPHLHLIDHFVSPSWYVHHLYWNCLSGRDHILGDDSELLNHTCALAIARDDGSPFDATSIQEEDIIELCVSVGWAHPKSVLWLLGTELVIMFWSSKEMLAVTHMVTKPMAWYEEPIQLCTSPPSTTHLSAYIAWRNAQPLGIQSLTSEGEEVPQSLPSNANMVGGSHANSTWTLGTWGMPNYGS